MGGLVMYTRHLLGGGMYKFTDDGTDITTRQYYNVEGMMVAMKEWVNEGSKTTNFFASDHLSSTSLVMDSSGALLSENRYMPFGEVRTISGTTNITETDFSYTGQRDYSDDFGLMDYHARFYSPTLGRFTQPDTVVPEPGNSQAWNRYSYTVNNPVKYKDPSGHTYGGAEEGEECTDSAECDLEGKDKNGNNILFDISFDSKDYTSDELSQILGDIGLVCDIVALDLDIIASAIVIAGAVIGTGATGLLDGPAVLGDATGWIAGMGYAEIYMQPIVQGADKIADFGSPFTYTSDMASGETSLNFSITLSNDELSVDVGGSIGASTQVEAATGLASDIIHEVLCKTALQAIDTLGTTPWGKIDMGINFNLPLR